MVDDEPAGGHIRIVGALAGVGSGLAKVTVGHGFDTIKTRLQCAPPGTYTGALDALRQVLQKEGFVGLYRGATPPAVGWAAIDSVLLGSLHNYRLLLIRSGLTEPVVGMESQRLTLFGHGIAGLFAGWTSAAVATPIELLKVKLQLQTQTKANSQFKGPIDCARQIVRAQGVRGLWTGFTGSLAFRSNFFFMFASFEAFMRGFSNLKGTKFEISTGTANFLSGGLGAFAFWGFAIAADNVKSKMMSQPLPPPGVVDSKRPSLVNITKQIYARDGPKGFFRGLSPTLLRAFPANACAFFVYEGTLRYLGAEKTRH